MKLLCWNVRGMGHPLTFFYCQCPIHRFRANMCFFMETRISVEEGKNIANRWGCDYCVWTSSDRLSEGTLLAWDDSIDVSISSINKNMFFAFVRTSNERFWFTCIYESLKMSLGSYV
ncbi:hypothetical protein PTKIN_Ptkin16aG0100200 [Pterospermum kingtungense]